ncbi:MAG TPA: ATP-dependent DNA helicase RecG [Gemmatimonadaceae bacterium]|nr:ATP-dependent DNA helicase RecG [Gemmatimonadaceae bacterium]
MSPREASAAAGPRRTLETPVHFLTGVGPRRAELLKRLNIFTARDLLFHIPHRYEDASTVAPIARLRVGEDATVIGTVISKGILPTRKGLRVFQAVVQDASGLIEVGWPGQPWLDRQINKGDVLLLSGPVRFFHGRQLSPREFVNLGADADGTGEGRVLAVYPATEGLSFKMIRGLIEQHLDVLLPQVEEYIPASLLAEAGVPPLREALRAVHRPVSVAEALRGRARLAYEELLFVHILQRRARVLANRAHDGIAFTNRKELTSQLRETLPFALTHAQVRAVNEIVADMAASRRMQRLLQGDVGSGKTVVAVFAALLAMENGYQVALMAPTELLAEQHARTIDKLLAPLGIIPALITGSRSASERRLAATRLESAEPLIAVGTHALVQEGTKFAKLGLAIIDEQHRFGVDQRRLLAEQGEPGAKEKPDVLLMSATPIPRSLALTMYGDLDVSTLDERPPGRQPVTTALRPDSGRARVMAFVERQVAQGRQAYIVYPLVDESEKVLLKAATKAYEELSGGPFKDRRVALLHGRMSGDEKDAVMRRFLDGEIDVLVATTVIEVGIDVPNATVMVIEHPERFGLSQLHQLRGRVGRGAEESYCILLGDVSDEAAERLQLFVGTDDGFAIARADLRLRGMGDLFGERQSGVPTFKVADPLRDEELGELARRGAERLLADDPELSRKDHKGLHDTLLRQYGRALELFRVG